MHDTTQSSEARIERFLRDVLAPQRARARRALTVESWSVRGEPVPFSHAVAQPFEPFVAGSPWGQPWDTVWFRIAGEVPADWAGENGDIELEIDLGYSSRLPGFQAEGIVYTPDGQMVKGLEPLNRSVSLPKDTTQIDFYIEAAANPNIADDFSFQPTLLGHRDTAGNVPLYVAKAFDLVLRDRDLVELWYDATTLWDLAQHLPPSLPRRHRIVEALNKMIDTIDPSDASEGGTRARTLLADELSRPAYASAHHAVAVGHAHIDCAWLWPTRETVRKFARTMANVLNLIDSDDEFIFVASSAQQYAWIEEHYPELFDRVRKAVSAGRIVPVGGMWVESDATMIGGESMIRQFLVGSRYFRETFNIESDVVWLPDSFGFSAALPQIFRGVGATGFVTQKMSWSDTNRMPHHTFAWEGIDGTRILSHFPPVDSYMSDLGAADLEKAERQYSEKSTGSSSIVPFGWGDGGGGPTREMLATGRRKSNLEGSPRVSFGTPSAFFEQARVEFNQPSVWSGELYLELHRGVFTSQAQTKQGNRRSERLLHEAELWSATATLRVGEPYPSAEIEAAWRIVLLQQFHDILPGTSISWVHEEAEANYRAVDASLQRIIHQALLALTGAGDQPLEARASPTGGSAMSVSRPAAATQARIARSSDDGLLLESDALRVVIDEQGHVSSLIDRATGREFIVDGHPAGEVQLFRDRPALWDAWDIDEHYRRTRIADVGEAEVTLEGDTVISVRRFGGSEVVVRWRLSPDGTSLDVDVHIDWFEDQNLLKLAFPVAILADRAASETLFGHVNRPTHRNTSWDEARYETVAHRFVHVEEPGAGIVIANASAYGWDIGRLESGGRAVGSLLRATLLRASNFPDPQADRGSHDFELSIRPTQSVMDAVREGYRRSYPARLVTGAQEVQPLVTIDAETAVIETVKLADDGSGDLVIRLYEAAGARSSVTLRVDVPWTRASCVDLLERPRGDRKESFDPDDGIQLALRPFEILTIRVDCKRA
jgi:alpha-mannosidase